VLLKTWRLAPHPDLAVAYAYARPGDSPRDRLVRVRHLARLTPNHAEAQLALALGAVEAREWAEARAALAPLLEDGRVTPRVCTLMARIEGEQNADAGRVREWLGRAATAPRDPAWTADGVALERWAPVSPVTGRLDAVRWTVPAGAGDQARAAALAAKVEALVAPESAASPRADAAVPLAGSPAAAGHAAEGQVRDVPGRMLPATPAAARGAPARAPGPARLDPPRAPVVEPQGEPLDEPLDEPGASDVPFRARRPGAAATKPAPSPASAAARQPAQRQRKPAPETRIFVAPRAPDDPGPEAADGDDLAPGGFSTSGAKA
jgi:HemY protein